MALVFVTATHAPARAQQLPDGTDFKGEKGAASFYGKAHQGKRTASGSRFDQKELTAAHPWLPFGTKVLVTVEGTGRAVLVTITDRLPSRRRIIDLSREAAARLGIIRQGVALVTLTPG
jgi:rare lipoprotein A